MTTVRDNYRNGTLQRHVSALTHKYGDRYRKYRNNWENSKSFVVSTDFPMQIDLDTTDKCNLNCKYCNARNNFPRKATNKDISEEIICGLFYEVNNPKGKDTLCALDFGYLGEPLLNKFSLLRMLEMAKGTRIMELFLHTNGQLLDIDTFAAIAALGLTHLFISIDAATEATYREMRGASLQRVTENIMNIVDYKKTHNMLFPAIRVSFVQTPCSRHETESFIQQWNDIVDIVDIQTACDWLSPIGDRNIAMRCPQPWQRMSIGPSGELNACCAAVTDSYNGTHRLGVFPAMSIYEAWNSAKAHLQRNCILNLDLKDFPFCEECHIRTSPAITNSAYL